MLRSFAASGVRPSSLRQCVEVAVAELIQPKQKHLALLADTGGVKEHQRALCQAQLVNRRTISHLPVLLLLLFGADLFIEPFDERNAVDEERSAVRRLPLRDQSPKLSLELLQQGRRRPYQSRSGVSEPHD